jgi:transposase
MRSLLVRFRTMQVNQLRGLLYEFGATFRAGRVAGLAEIRERMAELEDTLPRRIILNLQDQLRRVNAFEEDIDQLERRIGAWQKQEAACRAISEVPGIGRLTATALVATIRDARTFKRDVSSLHFSDLFHGKTVRAARFDWALYQSEGTHTYARC